MSVDADESGGADGAAGPVAEAAAVQLVGEGPDGEEGVMGDERIGGEATCGGVFDGHGGGVADLADSV